MKQKCEQGRILLWTLECDSVCVCLCVYVCLFVYQYMVYGGVTLGTWGGGGPLGYGSVLTDSVTY